MTYENLPVQALSNEDLQKIWQWNAIVPSEVDDTVHNLISKQIDEHPKLQAVCAWDGDFKYFELDLLSSKLAEHLVQLGVGAETTVPLCFEKSKWTVVALLAVMRAGAAFTLLDPGAQPEARMKAIADQVRCKLVLTSVENQSLGTRLAERVVVVSEDSLKNITCVTENQHAWSQAIPSSALYIVFTSGSTGHPKGIVITHSNYLSGAMQRGALLGYGTNTRAFDFASYTFDASIERNLVSLIFGGCVCIPSDSARLDDIAGSISSLRANSLGLTPSVARLLKNKNIEGIKLLNLGGELAAATDISYWSTRTRVVNRYGPAEASIVSTINLSISAESDPRNIGFGVGAVTWVVDPMNHNSLVPIGAPGELLLEGPIVARGYLDGEETRKAFIADPTWLLIGSKLLPGRRGRLYKTGDMVKYNRDGSLNFLGRKDLQVKIRGQRLELGEVENHLRSILPTDVVADVIRPATDAGPSTGEPMLVAFVVMQSIDEQRNEENAYSANEVLQEFDEVSKPALAKMANQLHDSLSKTLPNYMIPSAYIPLRSKPMTVTGKTDRKKLREMASNMSAVQISAMTSVKKDGRQALKTQKELGLSHAWTEVLSVTDIGPDDSFFSLGGDSIRAMMLVEAARSVGLSLSVAKIFHFPILSRMAEATTEYIEKYSAELPEFSLLNSSIQVDGICTEVAEYCNVAVSSVEDIYPCTPLQEGLMALSFKRPGAYLLQHVIHLPDSVDHTSTQVALEKEIERSSIMRTRIVQTKENGLLQVVIRSAGSLDWKTGSNLDEYLKADLRTPVEFGSPLARFAVITIRSGHRYLVFSAHHTICDRFSLALLLPHLEQNRQELSSKRPPQFKHFIKYLLETDKKQSREFWKSQASGGSILYPSLPSQAYEPQANSRIRRYVRVTLHSQHQVTLATVIRTAWSILVARLMAAEDDHVVFGVTLTGRNAPVPGIQSMDGPTITTVPVRLQVKDNLKASEYMQLVQNQGVEMIPYEQYGLQSIRRVSNDASSAFDFQTLLVIQPYDERSTIPKSKDSQAREADELYFANTYALTLVFWLVKDGFILDASFDSSVIKPNDMERTLGQFEKVVDQLCRKPQALVKEIDCLSQEDRDQILRWNRHAPVSSERTPLESITLNMENKPDAVAVSAWDGEISYSRLNELSAALANHLDKTYGVKQGMIVPLLFEKSLWTVVAVLGLMKAGATFVLLDDTQPEARLHDIVEQTSRSLILTSIAQEALGSKLATSTFTVSKDSLERLPSTIDSSLKESSLDNTLYVVFTSGTTGKPKGVEITNCSFASGVLHRASALYPETPRVLNFASYGFDAGIEGLLLPLMLGGCVCEPSDAIRRNDLTAFLNEKRVEAAVLTPSVARLLEPEKVPNLRNLMLVGEPMSSIDIEQWSGSNVKLSNIYGPAEASVASVGNINVTLHSDSRNIGKGLGAVTWIVDGTGELLPISAIGELWIEGPVVGKGYLNDPTKTATSFVESPQWLQKSRGEFKGRKSRLYRTGDLVKYDSDGSIIFMGRKDAQVKLRGQRIEVSEIEHNLRAILPADADVIVDLVTPEVGNGTPTLVGFVHLKEWQSETGYDGLYDRNNRGALSADTYAINKSLADKVPQFMIPSTYIPIRQVPITSSGKVDRRQLKSLGAALASTKELLLQNGHVHQKRAPITEKEGQLQKIWSQILELDSSEIGLDDSFFDLGGESIGAMKMVGAARSAGLKLSTVDVFHHPKLGDMATKLEDVNASTASIAPYSLFGSSEAAEAIHTEVQYQCDEAVFNNIEDILPCSPIQITLMAYTLMGGMITIQYVRDLDNLDEVEALKKAWEHVVASSPILRTWFFGSSARGFVQVVMKPGIPWLFGDNLNTYLEEDTKKAMGLKEVLNRFAIITDKETGKYHLVWTAHHCSFDGWSTVLVNKRIEDALRGDLVVPKAEYKDFIKHLSEWDQGAAATYWTTMFSNPSWTVYPNLPSPEFKPKTKTQLEHTVTISVAKAGVTMSMLIRAAWAILVSRLTNSNDVVFGLTLTGRDLSVAHIDEVEGPTMTVMPYRVISSPCDTLSAFLDYMQAARLEMIPHEPLGPLVSNLAPECAEGQKFQTSIAVQPQAITEFSNSKNRTVQNEKAEGHNLSILLIAYLLPDGVKFQPNFDVDVISEKKMVRLMEALGNVMGLFLERPDLKIEEVDVSEVEVDV